MFTTLEMSNEWDCLAGMSWIIVGALSCGDSGRGYICLACLLISLPEKVTFYKDIACALCIFMQTHSRRRAWFNYRKTGNADINTPVFNFVSLFKQLKKTQKTSFCSGVFWLSLNISLSYHIQVSEQDEIDTSAVSVCCIGWVSTDCGENLATFHVDVYIVGTWV